MTHSVIHEIYPRGEIIILKITDSIVMKTVRSAD